MKIKKILLLLFIILGALFGYSFIQQKLNQKPNPFKLYANIIPNTYRVGFTNLDKEVYLQNLAVVGTIPDWISGTLYRNGPAKFELNGTWITNWLDGLAMIHAFEINNGKVNYTNKYLKTTDYQKVNQTGKISYTGFASDPCKSIFKRLFSFFESNTFDQEAPNANINIAKFTDKYVALYETPLPVIFDNKTLETLDVMVYEDDYPDKNIHDTAHPHYDPVAKEHIAYFTKFGQTSSHNVYRIKDGSTKRELIGSYETKEPSYMHSFFLTKNYVILTALPLRVNPLDMLIKKRAFIKYFKWRPELGTELLVFDRINNKFINKFKLEPFFAFHTVNAYEEGKNIIMDIITYPDDSVINKADLERLLAPFDPKNEYEKISFKRFILNLDLKTVDSKQLTDEQLELPRINYDKFNAKDYNFVYAFAKTKEHKAAYIVADKLIKLNVKTGETINWFEQNCFPGEPIFLGKPGSSVEDEGIIVSVILDAQKENSFLLVLDAQTFKELARVYVPHHIPFGIHGQFYS